MAAVTSFQGVKVVSKVRAAKANVRVAPVANMQKASKVRRRSAAPLPPGPRSGARDAAERAGNERRTELGRALPAELCYVAGWGWAFLPRRARSRQPIGGRAPRGRRDGRLIGAPAGDRLARARLGGWGAVFLVQSVSLSCRAV